MKTIYKHTLTITEFQYVRFPGANARPLSLQFQHGKPQLWVMVDTNVMRTPGSPARNNLMESRLTIQMLGTGQITELPEAAAFIDTLQFNDGELVLHVFWRTDL